MNGTSRENIIRIIDLIGGIERIGSKKDVIVIKANIQWWNQGAPNIAALYTLVEMIMEQAGGFDGEIVIAENCHRGRLPWKAENAGWRHSFSWNSNLEKIDNYNSLAVLLKKKYGNRISICHWFDIDAGGKRVYHPTDGPGYVYCDGTGNAPLIKVGNGLKKENFREVIMTYPIFKTDQGTIIDLKNGIWKNGCYTNEDIRLINFAGINHHSRYCGATSALKNYLGIVDMSGGPDPFKNGKLTENYFNFHSFPFNKWSSGPVPGLLGREIGVFLKSIRKADLNITTAEWIGLSSRVMPPVAHTKAIIASIDPVALDFHATKYLLFSNSKIWFHSPENTKSPVYQYLKACEAQNGGTYDEKQIDTYTYDARRNKKKTHKALPIIGRVIWGRNLKTLLKYYLYRYKIV